MSPALQPMELWSSCAAEVGREPVLAGFASRRFSSARAAAVCGTDIGGTHDGPSAEVRREARADHHRRGDHQNCDESENCKHVTSPCVGDVLDDVSNYVKDKMSKNISGTLSGRFLYMLDSSWRDLAGKDVFHVTAHDHRELLYKIVR